jgi:hypothetical protein
VGVLARNMKLWTNEVLSATDEHGNRNNIVHVQAGAGATADDVPAGEAQPERKDSVLREEYRPALEAKKEYQQQVRRASCACQNLLCPALLPYSYVTFEIAKKAGVVE